MSVLLIGGVACATLTALSQSPAQKPSFEVASVKRNTARPSSPEALTLGCHGTDSHSPGPGGNVPLGRCVSRYEPLRLVLALAYDIPPSAMYPYEGKVLSGPDWINSEIYDIDAKAEAPTSESQLKVMLQELLSDRFKLKVHRESREMPVYALVTGKNGAKLQRAPEDRECGDQRRSDHRYELGATSLAGQCHAFVPDRGSLRGQSVEMSDFAEMLSIWAGRIVIDKTGIKGLFDIKMPPMTSANAGPSVEIKGGDRGGPPAPVPERALPDAPQNIFTALDQIGLKLEASKGPVEVFVIDSIQKPSEN